MRNRRSAVQLLGMQRMPKVLCLAGMVIAIFVFAIFLLDLVLAWPFEKASWGLDATFVSCAVLLGYLSWTAFRELD